MVRRKARELALQVLFQIDISKTDREVALAQSREREPAPDDGLDAPSERALAYAMVLVRGTTDHLEELDTAIAELAREWSLKRMANVDRNILRLAAYEVLHEEDVPTGVVINEAVELAKLYSGAESSRFVNGVLGNLVRRHRSVPAGAAVNEGDASMLPGD